MSGLVPSRLPGQVESQVVTLVYLRNVMIAIGLLLLPVVAGAVDPKPPAPDTDFLEFLGSGDDDPDLQQYAARQDETRPDTEKPAPKRVDGKI